MGRSTSGSAGTYACQSPRAAVRGLSGVLALGLIVAAGSSVAGPPAGQPPDGWRTGPALAKQLATVLPNASWSNAPLRHVVQSISRAGRLAILIDRRVDPDQRLDLTLHDASYEDILRQIAEDRGLGMTVLGPVIYLGPADASARLRTVSLLAHQQARTLPADAERRFLRAARMGWPDFATPRELLSGLAAAEGIRLSGLEQVPHDLWAGADLPPLSLVDRLLLVAVQFDLTLKLSPDGRGVTLVPIPDDVAIVREYPGGRQAHQLAAKWAALAPDCEIEVAGERIVVRGLLEDHERISGAGRPSARPGPRKVKPDRAKKRWTVRGAKGPMDRVLEQLAAKLQVEVRIDRQALAEAGISPSVEVSFSVREATLDELLRAAVEPAGCTFRRQGSVVEVFPAR